MSAEHPAASPSCPSCGSTDTIEHPRDGRWDCLSCKTNFRDPSAATMQDRPPNFRENGKLYLVRCFNCGGERGTENYALAVATGTCAFCGWCEGRFREVEVNV